ncbi:unnamed protein product [Eruca vesicaria subsp. sativa]|uniref:Uncharacterized protein n=1 Tax=Eruca vesicaria subsp. sativa TaxID=29727 RepID=A0ABC8LPN9_ERUVS|nr:unnamed protein product [Eruca vesicaria subsp. sativa]
MFLFFLIKGVHGISNVFNATQLIFNPPGPQFDEFRSKLPKNDIVLTRDDGKSGSTLSWQDEFKLVLLVTDDSTEEARFLIFDDIASPFLRRTADELAEEVAEDASISYADDASKYPTLKNGNNKRQGDVIDDDVVNKQRH